MQIIDDGVKCLKIRIDLVMTRIDLSFEAGLGWVQS